MRLLIIVEYVLIKTLCHSELDSESPSKNFSNTLQNLKFLESLVEGFS
jgi:hypothetical protein